MSEYKKGAENLPLRQINTSMPVLVIVYDLNNNDEVVIEKQIDFANYEDRKWVGRLSFWCYTNHHSIETMSMSDAMVETVENK